MLATAVQLFAVYLHLLLPPPRLHAVGIGVIGGGNGVAKRAGRFIVTATVRFLAARNGIMAERAQHARNMEPVDELRSDARRLRLHGGTPERAASGRHEAPTTPASGQVGGPRDAGAGVGCLQRLEAVGYGQGVDAGDREDEVAGQNPGTVAKARTYLLMPTALLLWLFRPRMRFHPGPTAGQWCTASSASWADS